MGLNLGSTQDLDADRLVFGVEVQDSPGMAFHRSCYGHVAELDIQNIVFVDVLNPWVHWSSAMAAAAEVLDLPLDDIGEVSPLPVPPTRATRRRMRSCYVVRWPSFSSNTVSATDQYFSS